MFDRLRRVLDRGGDRAHESSVITGDQKMHAHPDRLVLYHTRWCGYCVRVWRAIEGLGLTVEARDIDSDPQARADLVAVRGRSTVPVLRISFAQGPDRWMPESADIIRYLRGLEGDLKAGR